MPSPRTTSLARRHPAAHARQGDVCPLRHLADTEHAIGRCPRPAAPLPARKRIAPAQVVRPDVRVCRRVPQGLCGARRLGHAALLVRSRAGERGPALRRGGAGAAEERGVLRVQGVRAVFGQVGDEGARAYMETLAIVVPS